RRCLAPPCGCRVLSALLRGKVCLGERRWEGGGSGGSAAQKILHTPRLGKGCAAFPPVAPGDAFDRAARPLGCWVFRGRLPTTPTQKARRSGTALPPKQRLKTSRPPWRGKTMRHKRPALEAAPNHRPIV